MTTDFNKNIIQRSVKFYPMNKYILCFVIVVCYSCNSRMYHLKKDDRINFSYNGHAIPSDDITLLRPRSAADLTGTYIVWKSNIQQYNWNLKDMHIVEIIGSKNKIFARMQIHNDAGELAYKRIPVEWKKGVIHMFGYSYVLAELNKTHKIMTNIGSGTKGLFIQLQKSNNDDTGQDFYLFNYYDNVLSESLDQYTYGSYPEFSFVRLTASEIDNYKPSDYKKIKNEILARKGYAFTNDKETRTYYESQKWYRGQLKFTEVRLSEVEKHNLALLAAKKES